jgi:hypothetical protein
LGELRFGVSNSQLVAVLVASVVAMHVATITGFWYAVINLPPVDWNHFNGTYLLPAFSEAGYAQVFLTGWVFHFLTGVALGTIFAFLIRPLLPIPYTLWGNLGAAVGFGVFLALVSMFLLVPLVDPYGANPGFMSLDLQLMDADGNLRSGWQTPLVILIWHLIWGVHFGGLYQPKEAPAGVTPIGRRSAAPAERTPVGAPGGGS